MATKHLSMAICHRTFMGLQNSSMDGMVPWLLGPRITDRLPLIGIPAAVAPAAKRSTLVPVLLSCLIPMSATPKAKRLCASFQPWPRESLARKSRGERSAKSRGNQDLYQPNARAQGIAISSKDTCPRLLLLPTCLCGGPFQNRKVDRRKDCETFKLLAGSTSGACAGP
jgi:hypothetical protein